MRPLPFVICLALAPLPGMAQDADAGGTLYRDFCAACHGVAGKGDGTMADLMRRPPADLTRLAGGGPFPILRVAATIDGRGRLPAHGGDMPVFGRWFEGAGPDVAMAGPDGQPILMSAPVADLIAYLITLQD